MLEKIQIRATKLIPGLRDLGYKLLNKCGLTTLGTRILRRRFSDIDPNIFFSKLRQDRLGWMLESVLSPRA